MLAKRAAEGVSPNDHEKWMSEGGGVRQWTKQRKMEYIEGGGEEEVIRRAMGWKRKAVTSYCRLRRKKGIGKWWEKKIGQTDDAVCSRCGEEEETHPV